MGAMMGEIRDEAMREIWFGDKVGGVLRLPAVLQKAPLT